MLGMVIALTEPALRNAFAQQEGVWIENDDNYDEGDTFGTKTNFDPGDCDLMDWCASSGCQDNNLRCPDSLIKVRSDNWDDVIGTGSYAIAETDQGEPPCEEWDLLICAEGRLWFYNDCGGIRCYKYKGVSNACSN